MILNLVFEFAFFWINLKNYFTNSKVLIKKMPSSKNVFTYEKINDPRKISDSNIISNNSKNNFIKIN